MHRRPPRVVLGIVLGIMSTSAAQALDGAAPVWVAPGVGLLPGPLDRPLPAGTLHERMGLRWGDALAPARSGTAPVLPFTVVEMQNVNVPALAPTARKHHMLSLRSNAVEQAVRSWGLDASECQLQFRMPSKISQGRNGVSFDAAAQLRLGCQF